MPASLRPIDGGLPLGVTSRLKASLTHHLDYWVSRYIPRGGQGPSEGDDCLARLGGLTARLASTPLDLKRIQRLRYDVFFEGTDAKANAWTRFTRRDADAYDSLCDHLLVSDSDGCDPRTPRIVGTYRLLGQDVAMRHRGFYSAGEYDIAPLIARNADLKFLELGRSCVLPSHRNKRTIEVLWQGISTYLHRHRFSVMIGCASFPGTDPERLALPLSFLHHHARAEGRWQVAARPERFVDMNRMPADRIDARAALRELPPLIKGYMRLGAKFGDGAVVDHDFGTTDVFVIMPVAGIGSRYLEHFAPRDLQAA